MMSALEQPVSLKSMTRSCVLCLGKICSECSAFDEPGEVMLTELCKTVARRQSHWFDKWKEELATDQTAIAILSSRLKTLLLANISTVKFSDMGRKCQQRTQQSELLNNNKSVG